MDPVAVHLIRDTSSCFWNFLSFTLLNVLALCLSSFLPGINKAVDHTPGNICAHPHPGNPCMPFAAHSMFRFHISL